MKIKGYEIKRSYIVGFGAIIYSLGAQRHWWPFDAEIALELFGCGVITLRQAIAKEVRAIFDGLE